MEITTQSLVADIATHAPATIRIFQAHDIDFCCGGRRPLAEACTERGLDVEALLWELRLAGSHPDPTPDWSTASLTELVHHVQQRYHQTLQRDLPWLGQMLVKVVERHGPAHPETRTLQEVFNTFHLDLLHHMRKEDQVLFPAIVALESGAAASSDFDTPIAVLEADHDETSRALERMRELTQRFTAPSDACPTFRGLYEGLAEVDRDMRVHVHLENHVLFPRAGELARSRASAERAPR